MGCGCSEKLETQMDEYNKKLSNDHQFDMYAAIMGHKPEKVNELIEKSFDIKYRMPSFNGKTALHIAAEYGNTDIIMNLLSKGTNIDCLDNSGCPPLYMALQNGHVEAVKLLMDFDADVKIKTRYGMTFSNFICKAKYKEIKKILEIFNYNIETL